MKKYNLIKEKGPVVTAIYKPKCENLPWKLNKAKGKRFTFRRIDDNTFEDFDKTFPHSVILDRSDLEDIQIEETTEENKK